MIPWPPTSSIRLYTGRITARQGGKVAAQGTITYDVENEPVDPPESIVLKAAAPVRRFNDDEEIIAADEGEYCTIQVGPGEFIGFYLWCPEQANAGPCITPPAGGAS